MEFDIEEIEEVSPKHPSEPFCNGSGGFVP